MRASKIWLQENAAMILFFLMVGVIGGYSYLFDFQPKREVEIKKEEEVAALLAPAPEPKKLDEQVKIADCQIRGPLPDHDCTPGAVLENATLEKICVSGYTKTVRSVSPATKKKVFAMYGIAYPVPFGDYEIDHLIPLAIGGSNDVANLFPEARKPYPGFQEKDVVENYLHEHVCAREIDLHAAQVQVANDWLSIYNGLSEEVVKDYKARYKSWAPNE